MKVIATRSPYIIEINETNQVGSKLELFVWHKGETEPATPTYTLSKAISSTVNRSTVYNISQYILENIKITAPVDINTITPEDNNAWCLVKVKRYKLIGTTYTLLDTNNYVGVEGYSNYMDGVNNLISTSSTASLVKNNLKYNYNSRYGYFNVLIEGNEAFPLNVRWETLTGGYEIEYETEDGEIYNFKIPYVYDDTFKPFILVGQEDTFLNITVEQVCEPKYTPVVCTFINRYGGWQYLTFFKSNSTAIETKGNDYKLMPASFNYNPQIGQKRTFNTDGTQTIKLNTGWVEENYSELIKDLMLSETILLDGKPVILKTKSTALKTGLNDKNINYEIEFEYAFSLINNVI
jgi:hypothetical protein